MVGSPDKFEVAFVHAGAITACSNEAHICWDGVFCKFPINAIRILRFTFVPEDGVTGVFACGFPGVAFVGAGAGIDFCEQLF